MIGRVLQAAENERGNQWYTWTRIRLLSGQRRDYGSYEDEYGPRVSGRNIRPKDHMNRQEGTMLSLKEKK